MSDGQDYLDYQTRLRPITGNTRIAAVIGDPVRHSLSPALHNAAFAATGLDWRYIALHVERGHGAQALRAMQTLGIGGLSVTMPHKDDAARTCDELSDAAVALRSVNCVSVLADGRLRGDSTDGDGFVRSLREAGVVIAGMKVALLGAGGAARAVAVALANGGAEVHVAARRAEAANDVAALATAIDAVEWVKRDELVSTASIVVNSTPLGMLGNPELPCSVRAIRARHIVADLVYTPLETPLLQAAREIGATPIDGLGMLVHQAARAFEIWTNVSAPTDIMRAAALAELAARARN